MGESRIHQSIHSAVQHHAAGRLAQADLLYRGVLTSAPDHPDALYGLGMVSYQTGRFDDAIALWKRVSVLCPQRADVFFQLSIALLAKQEAYQSVSAAKRAVDLQPTFSQAHSQLAVALAAIGKHDEAIAAASRAVELAPSSAESHNSLGHVLHRAGRLDGAADAFRRAIAIDPSLPGYHINLAAVLDALDDVEGSIAAGEAALALGAATPDLLANLATMYRRGRDYRRSAEYAARALKLSPNHPSAHGARAIALLAMGDYLEGFREYEWRWRCASFTTAAREFPRPMWDGSDPSGRTILVHTEQGFGDVIQFARYLPMLAQCGAKVILECNAALKALMTTVAGVSRVVPAGMSLPDFDLHAPILSLPRAMGTTIDSVPRDVPYLHADPARAEQWKSRIGAGGFHIGLVWWGNPKPDPARSCPPGHLRALADAVRGANVKFFSLQKGDLPREAASAPAELGLSDLGSELKDFADTAATMMNLDLVITIDTAAAHLAGALARPVWTLLPWSPDWRWMLEREDSVWYPTMRLFRQEARGDWAGVTGRVSDELRRLVSGR